MIQLVSEWFILRANFRLWLPNGNILWSVANTLCQHYSISYSNQSPKTPYAFRSVCQKHMLTGGCFWPEFLHRFYFKNPYFLQRVMSFEDIDWYYLRLLLKVYYYAACKSYTMSLFS